MTTKDKTGAASSEEKLVNIHESELDTFKNSFNSLPISSRRPDLFQDPRQSMIEGPLMDSTYSKLWDKFFGK